MGLSLGGGFQNEDSANSSRFSGTGTQETTGQSSGTQTGTSSGSTTVNPTAGWGSINDILRNNIAGSGTGLNAGQTDAYNQLLNWRDNPNNTVNQISAVTPQIQNWINTAAPQAASGGPVTSTAINGRTASDFMAPYVNPYDNQVVNATVADNSLALNKTLNDLRAQYGGQYGNGRGDVAAGTAVADSMTQLAPILAGIRQQGFNTELGAGQSDASRFAQSDISNQQAALDASKTNAANTLQLNEHNADLDAQKQIANINAMRDIVNNAVTSGQIGSDTAKTLFDMAGGGNTNLLQYLQSQVPAFGQSTTGTQTGTTNQNTSDSSTSTQSGDSSGQSSSRGSGMKASIGGKG